MRIFGEKCSLLQTLTYDGKRRRTASIIALPNLWPIGGPSSSQQLFYQSEAVFSEKIQHQTAEQILGDPDAMEQNPYNYVDIQPECAILHQTGSPGERDSDHDASSRNPERQLLPDQFSIVANGTRVRECPKEPDTTQTKIKKSRSRRSNQNIPEEIMKTGDNDGSEVTLVTPAGSIFTSLSL